MIAAVFYNSAASACADSCATEENACSRMYCYDCDICKKESSSTGWTNIYSSGSTNTGTGTYLNYGKTTETNSVTPPLAPTTSSEEKATTSAASAEPSSGGSENRKGSHVGDQDQEQDCSLDAMRKKYLPDNGTNLDSCWYCKVVTIMTNAFLSAAVNAMIVCIELGILILKLGFTIWLAYYLLQQVSSVAPIKLGEMLETILVMGFKVALAGLAIKYAQDTLASLLVNPIMLTGIDYGGKILEGILNLGSAGGG